MGWLAVKRLASSKFSALLAIIPVVGWLLVLNDHFAVIIAKLTGLPQLESPGWQVYAFHAGLSLFGLGVLLFQLVAPKHIALYASVDDFVERQMALITRERYKVFRSEAGEIELAPERTSPAGDQDSRDLWLARNRGNIITVLDAYFSKLDNRTRPVLAWTCMILLIVGAATAITPSITTIWWSIGRFLESVGS